MNSLILNLPILPILILIFAALISSLTRSFRASHIAIIIALSLVMCILYMVFNLLSSNESITLFVGGWKPPIGIELKIDHFNIIFISLFIICTFTLGIYLVEGIKEIPEENHNQFCSLILFTLAGFLGMLITNDIFSFYVFLEIASIASYALITCNKLKNSYLAAFEYLVIGSIASTLILLGIGFLYFSTGTLNLTDLSIRLKEVYSLNTTKAGISFIFIGLILKSAFFPFQSWLCKIYQHSAICLSSFFAATSSNISLIFIIKVSYLILDKQFFEANFFLRIVLIGVACITMVKCSIRAFYQKDIKSIMANSSCVNFSYILLSVALYHKDSYIAGMLLLTNHLVAKFTILLILGLMKLSLGNTQLQQLSQFSQISKYGKVTLLINLLFLGGMPFTMSFIGKWGILQVLLESHLYILSPIMLFSIFCSFGYYGKLMIQLFITNSNPKISNTTTSAKYFFIIIPICLLTCSNICAQILSPLLIKYYSTGLN